MVNGPLGFEPLRLYCKDKRSLGIREENHNRLSGK